MLHDEFFHKFKIEPCEVFYFSGLLENSENEAFDDTTREFLKNGVLKEPYGRYLFIVPLIQCDNILYCVNGEVSQYGYVKSDKLFTKPSENTVVFDNTGYYYDDGVGDFSIIHAACLMMLTMKATRKEQTEISEILNNRRKKSGKPTLVRFTTISNPPYSSSDGTHASPIPHWRRGHVRRGRSGKIQHIDPTIVNAHIGEPVKREAYKV